jgi:hypothetical protein
MRVIRKRTTLTVACVALLSAGDTSALAQNGERRCGWLWNPTPANWWLTDRDGEWTLGVQGGYQAQGLDNMPDMSTAGWVVTNTGGYGYGCACLRVVVDRVAGRVLHLLSAQPLPLARCRSDPSLPTP